jgi:hypothetical protein
MFCASKHKGLVSNSAINCIYGQTVHAGTRFAPSHKKAEVRKIVKQELFEKQQDF